MSRYTNIAVQHRGDYPLTGLQFNGEELVWQPREIKHLPEEVARHFIRNAICRFNPITLETVAQLVVRTPGDEEPPVLTYADGHPVAMLDTTDLPPTSFDAEGRPLHGEVKEIAQPTGMLRGRIPAGANAGVSPKLKGAAGPGLGAKDKMPDDIAARLDAGTDKLIEAVG